MQRGIQSFSMKATEFATFAGGCFWCTESIFLRLKGVIDVVSGYTGGTIPYPTYEQVGRGDTGHAESIQITFDPGVISYETLVEVFFKLHDPTTLNRQGADSGSEYRSAIFYHSEEQKQMAYTVRDKIAEEGIYADPIITEIVPATQFYEAEDYHQDFYENNKGSMYCSIVIDPKIQKLFKEFGDKVKDEYLKRD